MIKIVKPNENPYRRDSRLELAWRIVRGYGGCNEEECVAALDAAGLARHGDKQVGNRGYLRQFHRDELLILQGYRQRGNEPNTLE